MCGGEKMVEGKCGVNGEKGFQNTALVGKQRLEALPGKDRILLRCQAFL